MRGNVLVFSLWEFLSRQDDVWMAHCVRRLQVLPGLASTLFFPHVPLPLLEMGEAINAKEGDGAVVLVGVVGMKVNANVSIKVANIHWGMKRLRKSISKHTSHAAGKTHLHTTHILPKIRTDDRPALCISNVRLSDANRELLENATEELKVGKLYRVDTDILAQLDDDELRRSTAWRQHVPVSLRR